MSFADFPSRFAPVGIFSPALAVVGACYLHTSSVGVASEHHLERWTDLSECDVLTNPLSKSTPIT